MALFKKTQEVDYETEASLPAFSIDGNGFIMFDDPSLGGAAVLEVMPNTSTEGMTHEDPVYHNTSTDEEGYEPTLNKLFGDERALAYPAWVWFLNKLHSQDDADDAIHLQVIAKKCHPDNHYHPDSRHDEGFQWETRIDYAVYKAHELFDPKLSEYARKKDGKSALMSRRMDDYISMLEGIQEETRAISPAVFDARTLPSYKMKYYIVVSYTPSSEGWWLDGRDASYYVASSRTYDGLVSLDTDKLVDSATGLIARLRRQPDGDHSHELHEDDFFWIESDRCAQIIDTRLNKIYDIIDEWNHEHADKPMPFAVRLLDERETPALIRFFNNPLTTYWKQIWHLGSDQNDILYKMEVERSINAGDTSIVENRDVGRAIAAGDFSMLASAQERDEYLDQYRGRSYDSVRSLAEQLRDEDWSPEKEEQQLALEAQREQVNAADVDLFGFLGENAAISEENKTAADKQNEYLARYRKISASEFAGSLSGGEEDDVDDLFSAFEQ